MPRKSANFRLPQPEERSALIVTFVVAAASILWPCDLTVAQEARVASNPPTVRNAPSGFVLLRNQSVLRGDANQKGSRVVVSRSDGTRLELNSRNVLCWGKTIQDLYRYRVDHRASNSIASHLDDARWCLKHGQLDLVVKELRYIRSVDPDNATAMRIQRQLYHAVVAKRREQESKSASPITQADFESEVGESGRVALATATTPEADEPDPATLKSFAHTLQPILLNRCANCHAQNTDLAWRLQSPTPGSRPSAAMTRYNLASVSRYISYEVPLESELRIRAMDGHAGKKNSFGIRVSSATTALEHWLSVARPAGAPLALAKRALNAETHVERSPSPRVASEVDPPADEDESVKRLPEVANPFDPGIFNRRMQLK